MPLNYLCRLTLKHADGMNNYSCKPLSSSRAAAYFKRYLADLKPALCQVCVDEWCVASLHSRSVRSAQLSRAEEGWRVRRSGGVSTEPGCSERRALALWGEATVPLNTLPTQE